jgi:hypothetical protein
MAKDDDLDVLRWRRPEQQQEKLQDPLKRDVKNGQKHGTSANTTRGPLFYADRINAPHRLSKTVDERSPNMFGAVRDPFVNDTLGDNPWFKEILRRTRLPM